MTAISSSDPARKRVTNKVIIEEIRQRGMRPENVTERHVQKVYRDFRGQAAVLPVHRVNRILDSLQEDEVVDRAVKVLEARMSYPGECMTTPDTVRNYLRLKLIGKQHEVFCVMYLDTRHRLLSFQELFRGTIDGASVHPREIAKEALRRNAAAIIIGHNHPSGLAEPSRADRAITRRIRDALGILDVRLLDHFVVGNDQVVSFAERGLI